MAAFTSLNVPWCLWHRGVLWKWNQTYCSGYETTCTNAEQYFGNGTRLTVLEKGTNILYPKVKILPPSKQEIKHNRVTLVCVVTNFFPDHVTVKWYINDRLENSRARTDDFATRSGQTYSITSRLRLSLKLWYSSKYSFTCSVNFFNGNYSKEFRASVQGNTGCIKTAGEVKTDGNMAKFSYLLLLAKSTLFSLFVTVFMFRLKGFSKTR